MQLNRSSRRLDRIKWHLPLWMLMVPALVYFLVYRYIPMAGLVIVFKNYRITRGIFGSDWVGLENFKILFSLPNFWAIVRNTIVISVVKLLVCFPMPIIIAIMLNEIKNNRFKRVIQTSLYLPHFLSWVVISHLVMVFLAPSSGIIPDALSKIGISLNMITIPENFLWTLVLSDLWKEMGWGTIIFLATIAGIDQSLYEAAVVDGANRWQRMMSITLPMLLPTILTLFILRIGTILNAGFDQIYVMQNGYTLSMSEILDTYIYKVSFLQGLHKLGAAAGLFKSVIGFILVLLTNRASKSLGYRVI